MENVIGASIWSMLTILKQLSTPYSRKPFCAFVADTFNSHMLPRVAMMVKRRGGFHLVSLLQVPRAKRDQSLLQVLRKERDPTSTIALGTEDSETKARGFPLTSYSSLTGRR